MQEYLKHNQKYWDARTPLNESSVFYDLSSFLMGESSLKAPELEALGDVNGKSLLHLQCHFGMDTLSWARLGAKTTGVDFSGAAIARARELSEQIGIRADFVQSDVLRLDEKLKGNFDLVFSSYGALKCLPDIRKWAQIVSHFLRKDGTFFIVDFHPMLQMFDTDSLSLQQSYFNENEPNEPDPGSEGTGREYVWNHSLAEITQALLDEGLQLLEFQEYPYTVFPWPEGVVNVMDNKYAWPQLPALPMLFSLKMTK